ncbi:MAG TPA: MFS transporter [Streptosporangiaceae bacterium]|nr:MFS transporter [Streptosporangiaceae bacterium]
MSFRVMREADQATATKLPSPTPAKAPAAGTNFSSRQKWLLIVCCVAQFMVILDLTIVNVALPSMQSDLNISAVDLQWVVDAYAILFAGFLMLAGRASDRFGRRRSLVGALTLFALASLAGGAALNPSMLIGARAVQGLAGALMAASSLAAITAAFPPGPGRHRAIGLWSAMNGAGGAAGAVFGGVITQELGWRWVLLINPPIGLAAAAVAYFVVVDGGVLERTKFDLKGAFSLTAGQLILAYGFVNGGDFGWLSPLTVGPIIGGFAVLGLFVVIETRWAQAPLVPLKSITKSLQTANLIVLTFSAALFPMWFVSSLYMQEVLGLSPLVAGLAFFPMTLAIFLVAQRAGKLVGLFGVRTVLTSGLLMMATGILLLTRIQPTGSALGFVIFPGILVASGIALSIVPSTIAATQGATPQQAGLASGMVNTSRQIGGAIGIALLISIATSLTSGQIGANRPIPDSLTYGFRIAYFIMVGLVLVAATIAFLGLRHRAAAAATSAGAAPAATAAPAAAGPAPAQAAPSAPAASAGPAAPAAPAAAAASAARPRRRFWLQMPVVVLAVIVAFFVVDFIFAGAPGAPLGAFSLKDTYSYVSAPSLHPPVIKSESPTVTEPDATPPGYIFMANFYDLSKGQIKGQSGPLILNNALQPVWFRPVPVNLVASDLAEQTYHGQPVLTWWQGEVTKDGDTTAGEYFVVNRHYQTIATLHGADGWILTLHTMMIDGDHAWVTANKDIPMNLGKYGGVADGAIADSAVQEYNLKTGKLIRTWDALDHIPPTDTHALPPANGFPWDVYHVNSISLNGDGTFVVSMRNTWATYDVDEATGKVLWILGGKHSTFKVDDDAKFEWQHDVTFLPHSDEVSLFDDHCCQLTGGGTYLAADGPSRGELLKLDQANRTASLVSQYSHDGDDAAYMGSAQYLPGGNVFVGWGSQPRFTEFSKSGQILIDGLLPSPDLSYRAIAVQKWIGLPLTKPSGAIRRSGGKTTVYASWNGATQVASWRVLAGSTQSDLNVVQNQNLTGFETAIGVTGHYQVFQVQALDSDGHVIGTSAPFN